MNNGGTGFLTQNHSTWGLKEVNAFNNGGGNFSPCSSPNLTNATTTNPNLGFCRVLIPTTATNLKGQGTGGADIGANVIYQYQNGVLTTTPLWDPNNELRFSGCGAVILGVNDAAATSCRGVHQRLNVGSALGCALPYEGEDPDSTYAVTRNLVTVPAQQTITASWVVDPGPAQVLDWICLTLASQQDCQQYIQQDGAGNQARRYIGDGVMTAPLTGDFSLTPPLQAGLYKFWYCVNNSTTNCPAESATFEVKTPPGDTGYVLVAAAWHKADVAPSANWIEGVGGNAQVRPGGKLRYVGSIACKDCAVVTDHYDLQCQTA